MKKKCLAVLVMFAVLSVSGCGESLEKEPEPEQGTELTAKSKSDQMTDRKKGSGQGTETAQEAELEQETEKKGETTMKISVKSADYEIVYELNNSQAAQELYEQLPLTLEVEDFSTNEKTFYPPKELDTSDAPMADADRGTLAYYAPWADVVMFYDYFGKGSGLYELGEAVSGEADIEKLSGEIEITVAE